MTTLELCRQIESICTEDYPLCSFDDIQLFLNALSIDQYKPNTIIIGGTNGKGSTVAILESVLNYNNISFVSHTSPHLMQFNERITYNSTMISNQSLIIALTKIQRVVHQFQLRLNYYQISFLCACTYMNFKMPKWFILEIGMGGRLDPANYFDADIAILTYIGLDHTEILGSNVEDIGLEKVPIARSNKPVILGSNMPVSVNNYLNQINANVIDAVIPQSDYYHDTNLPEKSLACALSAISCIRPLLTIPPNINTLQVPGRIEIIQQNPLIIVDVSHNPDAVSYLFEKFFGYNITYKNCIAIFGAHATKDIKSMIDVAKPYVDQWLIPDLNYIDDCCLVPEDIGQFLYKKNSKFFNCLLEVFKYLKKIVQKEDLIIIFGSFTLVAEWMRIYKQQYLLY